MVLTIKITAAWETPSTSLDGVNTITRQFHGQKDVYWALLSFDVDSRRRRGRSQYLAMADFTILLFGWAVRPREMIRYMAALSGALNQLMIRIISSSASAVVIAQASGPSIQVRTGRCWTSRHSRRRRHGQ